MADITGAITITAIARKALASDGIFPGEPVVIPSSA
jgi:hypothetical protein